MNLEVIFWQKTREMGTLVIIFVENAPVGIDKINEETSVSTDAGKCVIVQLGPK